MIKQKEKTVIVRILESDRKRIKIASAQSDMTILEYVNHLSTPKFITNFPSKRIDRE